jgi:hypothetical protein
MNFYLESICNVECDEFFVMNFIILILSKFDTEQKSSKFLLEITTVVSSANNTGCDVEFILS